MRLEPDEIDKALSALERAVLAQAGVAAEFEVSRREYFLAGEPPASDEEAPRAFRRHREWFLLERPSNVLGGAPVEWVLHGLEDIEAAELHEDALRALLASRCSVFQVTGVAEGEGVWVRDLAAMGEYPLSEPEGSRALSADDVIVGRLFAIGESLYRVSSAAGVFRSGKLLRALLADFESLRQARRGVLRLTQAELEGMFWRRIEPVRSDAVGTARAALAAGGVDSGRIEQIFADLRRSPFDASLVVYGVDDVLASVLESLAFDTRMNLGIARRVLLDAWAELAAPSSTEASASEGREERVHDARAAIEAFDAGRRAGKDLETLFRELERDLELESETYDPDAIDGAPAPDFPGVVGAMIEEFLWELGRTRGEAQSREVSLVRAFGEFGADYGVFENLSGRELLVFAAVWLPERRMLKSAEEVRRMLRALREFCAWSQENHGVALLDGYEKTIPPMERALARLVEAQRWCRNDGGGPSTLYEIASLDGPRPTFSDARGESFEADIEPRLAAALEVGDRLRARRVEGGRLEVFCCYPAQSASIAR
ncbi:MAG: hypothetical protein FJ294_13985 [Planctomycetes bacterium]|nr:hypothetical protein [Planctomycetota bacterium]